jgi:hypothetical protein
LMRHDVWYVTICKGKERDVTIIPDNVTAITAVPVTFTSISSNRYL